MNRDLYSHDHQFNPGCLYSGKQLRTGKSHLALNPGTVQTPPPLGSKTSSAPKPCKPIPDTYTELYFLGWYPRGIHCLPPQSCMDQPRKTEREQTFQVFYSRGSPMWSREADLQGWFGFLKCSDMTAPNHIKTFSSPAIVSTSLDCFYSC